MMTLDGHTYEVHLTGYTHKQTKFGSTERGLTGLPLRVEGGAFSNEYSPTLLCTITDISNLRTSLAKTSTVGTPPANLLSLTDEEGVEFSPGAGSDDPTHRYNTGVFFLGMSEPKPLTPLGWTAQNRFDVVVNLLVNDSAL
jgi:hypothetical protein